MTHGTNSIVPLPLLFGDAGFVVVLIVVIQIVIGLMIYKHYAERKRRGELDQLAKRKGWSFTPGKHTALATRWGQIDLFQQGSNRFSENVMTGRAEGLQFWLFDFHYETYTHDKNGRETHHHWHTCCVMVPPVAFPHELKVRPENFFDKIASAVGFKDINFESAEFSRKFRVKATDRKFAYDVIHPLMMEYLMRHSRLCFEIEGAALMVTSGSGRQAAAHWEYLQQTAAGLIGQLPEYLLAQYRQSPGGGAS